MSVADHAVYVRPTPEKVAQIIDLIGLEAAKERWFYLDRRTLGAMARIGRARLAGVAVAARRARSFTDEDVAVAVEAAHVFMSMTCGERATGLKIENAVRACFEIRGLAPLPGNSEQRTRASRLAVRANRGDRAAADALVASRALEKAVGEVIRRALPLVPEQPPVGRYRLPAPGPALTAALAGLDPLAVDLVFGDAA